MVMEGGFWVDFRVGSVDVGSLEGGLGLVSVGVGLGLL